MGKGVRRAMLGKAKALLFSPAASIIGGVKATDGGRMGDLPEWISAQNVVAWLTLGFSAMAAGVAWLGHRRATSEDKAREMNRWSIRTMGSGAGNVGIYARLRLDGSRDEPMRLLALTLKAPRGGLIAPSRRAAGGGVEPDADLASTRLTVMRDLDEGRGDPGSMLDFSGYWFFLLPPPRPWYSRRADARFVILVDAELISSSRRKIRISVKTQRIAWTSKKAAIER